MITARWRVKGIYNADAAKVADEIAEIGDVVEPTDLVNKARDECTELHKCFEWRDSVAAEKYRIHQARGILCNLVLEYDEKKNPHENLRLMYKTSANEGYKPINLIKANANEYKALLDRAYSELAAFKKKYRMLSELEDIFKLIP